MDEDAEVVVASSTYLSRTLGHHKDTHTFALILGRASMTQPRDRMNTHHFSPSADERMTSRWLGSRPSGTESGDSWRIIL